MTLAIRRLFETPLFVGEVTLCTADRGQCACESCDPFSRVTFNLSGIYRFHCSMGSETAVPGTALIYRGGAPFSVSHPHERSSGDACVVIQVRDEDTLDEVLSGSDARHQLRSLSSSALLTVAFWQAVARRNKLNDLAIEEATIAMLRLVLREDGSGTSAKINPATRHKLQRAQAFLAANISENVDLLTIAREACLSPYHLCRLFKLETGLTLRGYRLRMRLAVALSQIAEGEDNLSRLAAQTGFSHHSHFTATFRRYFGLTPSSLRHRLPANGISEFRTFLTAQRPSIS